MATERGITRLGLLGLFAVLVIAAGWLAACDGGPDETDQAPTVAPGGIPPLTTFPIVDLVLGGDGARLADLAVPQEQPCDAERAPRCKPGTEPGELVSVFPGGGCEPSWLYFEEVPALFAALSAQPPERLYAAYRDAGPEEDSDVYVFERDDGHALVVVVVTDGIRIVHQGCGNPPRVIVAGQTQWIVLPRD